MDAALGAAGGIRTSGLWSRSPTLYPAELRPHMYEGLETIWQNVPGAGKLYYSKGQSKKQSKFDETGWGGIKQLRLVQNCEKTGIRREKVAGPNRRFRK